MNLNISSGKARIAIAAAAAIIAASVAAFSGLAGQASAYPGYRSAPTVACSYNSQVLQMTASADALSGYNVQKMAATFWFMNLDTGKAYQSPWLYFYNTVTQDNPGGLTTSSHSNPGAVTQSYTMPPGHYVVFVAYSWLTNTGWTQATNWITTHSYSYKWDSLNDPQYLYDNCPVAVAH
jgi:hypothetical protein